MNKTKNTITFFIAWLLILTPVTSQNFVVDDTLVVLSGHTAVDPTHWYTAITNQTNNNLTMRWKLLQYFGMPGWQIKIVAPNDTLYDISITDSANFILEANTSISEKFIINIFANGQAGSGSAVFQVSEIGQPQYKQNITFQFNIQQSTIGLEKQQPDFFYYQNPGKLYLRQASKYKVYNLLGQLIESGSNKVISTNALKPGIYVTVTNTKGKIRQFKFAVP